MGQTSQGVIGETKTTTFAASLVKLLTELGVRHSFGIVGSGIAPFAEALFHSEIEVAHFRHECGAAFAAVEASLASRNPTVVFVTLAPGLLNVLTGIVAGKYEGARVLLVSALTPAEHRGKWAAQETSAQSLPYSGIFSPGPIFDYAHVVNEMDDIHGIGCALAKGFQKQNGFIAHLSIPARTQKMAISSEHTWYLPIISDPDVPEELVELCFRKLAQGSSVIWTGFGARYAAPEILELAEIMHCPVMSTPRGKGVFPENHPLYLGVTGFGGHQSILDFFQKTKPDYVIVLGTRMGEFSSFWQPHFVPAQSIIHVDLNENAFGAAFPSARTLGIKAEIKSFVKRLVSYFISNRIESSNCLEIGKPFQAIDLEVRSAGKVRPRVLMDVIQAIVVQRNNVKVMAESGNSFVWANHYLQVCNPHKYRTNTGFSSMGQITCGVVGVTIATGEKALAIVGDGAMLMNCEISTAVQYGAAVIWVVLNDSSYGLVRQGMTAQGFTPVETGIPPTNFALLAIALGAEGYRVESESEIEPALLRALESKSPTVIDVVIDPAEKSPAGARIESLIQQGIRGKNWNEK
jgi:acetolactate synthase-1/2/3 large subunit